MTPKSKTALFAGSFRPFTIGHKSIADRTLALCDRLVIAIGHNPLKPDEDVLRNADAIRRVYAADPRVEVVVYSELTVDLARRVGADFLVRGVRSCTDFEYERNLAEINLRVGGIETVLLTSLPELACISSSMVRELASYGKDISQYLPD